jgi:cephalosporin-C deacetylase-like acetyl esterase
MQRNVIAQALGLLLLVLPGRAQAAPASTPSSEPKRADPARRRAYLAEILRILPKSEAWETWLKQSGELPPDFSVMPSEPFLPDPLTFANGKAVGKASWPRRRQELLALFQYYVTGTIPGSPGNVEPADIRSHEETGALIDEVTLHFGPGQAARLHLELIIPKGRPPFPVFLTQQTHRHWALAAVSRGYIGCVYAGADSKDDTAAWASIWPDQDWTKLTRRAWAASRCIDYLYTLPVVDTNRIALAGHSRNGKTSLIAAAFDRRVNAVISSSSGAGGACSFRFFSEAQFGEGIELITRVFPDWLHPRLRFFAGRENVLPIDQHELIACIAPRPCLISSALNDNVESIWAVEKTYEGAYPVYELFNRGRQLNLRYRPGGHETRAADVESYLDWLDTVFDRGYFPFPGVSIYPTYQAWKALSGGPVDPRTFRTNGFQDLLKFPDGSDVITFNQWGAKRQDIKERIFWNLGPTPPFATSRPDAYGSEKAHWAVLLGRDHVPGDVIKRPFNFGNYVAGDLYYPTNADTAGKRIPAVIWVHPVSNSNGYVPGYHRGELPHLAMARAGFAVLAFDQIGNGSRLEEVRYFYNRYPYWSLLGKEVDDTLAGFEALLRVGFIDPARIYVVGFGPGGMVALHAAALEERLAGVVSVAGFSSLRRDRETKGTGALARWSRQLPLQPRLGAFVGAEDRIPYDYHEVLALIAPRPALIFAPRYDTSATLDDVRWCVDEADKVYERLGAKSHLRLIELEDYRRFSPESQRIIYQELKRMAGLPLSLAPTQKRLRPNQP